ncbi:ABC transporter permease [Gryllotalpicola protaetiae]|uniref:ABC transporter permease subunit n=1 Tax=Gryllotalpicola protaetiae TaxID=2419771 RepID=A0A387BMZ7_9MICO|nr:ABC transporter permease subunit [Gryllotalpicola protaetiae]AYG03782.1 ABC transporter permease subunit [Gryllotalpicola protaetiae]
MTTASELLPRRGPNGGSAEDRREERRRRWAAKGVDKTLWLLAPALIITVGLFIYPFIYGVMISFQPLAGGNPLQNYIDFFTSSYQRSSIWKTLRLAIPVAVVSLIIATPIAYRARRNFRGRQALTLVIMLPLTFGSVLMAQGLTRVLAQYGWVNLILTGMGLPRGNLLYNYTGTFISSVVGTVPFLFLLMMGFFGSIDPSIEDAASTLGASPTTRFWRVILPLAAPGLVTAFMLATVETFAIFPSAILVGDPANSTRVLTLPIYEAANQKSDYTQAAAIAIVLTLIELIILGVLLWVRGRLYRGPASGGKG